MFYRVGRFDILLVDNAPRSFGCMIQWAPGLGFLSMPSTKTKMCLRSWMLEIRSGSEQRAAANMIKHQVRKWDMLFTTAKMVFRGLGFMVCFDFPQWAEVLLVTRYFEVARIRLPMKSSYQARSVR